MILKRRFHAPQRDAPHSQRCSQLREQEYINIEAICSLPLISNFCNCFFKSAGSIFSKLISLKSPNPKSLRYFAAAAAVSGWDF